MRLENVHIWVDPPCYVDDLMILRNRVSGFECSNMGSAVLEGGRSDDIHIFCFQAEKCANMDCVDVKGSLFADCKEWHFQSRNVQIIAVPSCNRVIC